MLLYFFGFLDCLLDCFDKGASSWSTLSAFRFLEPSLAGLTFVMAAEVLVSELVLERGISDL